MKINTIMLSFCLLFFSLFSNIIAGVWEPVGPDSVVVFEDDFSSYPVVDDEKKIANVLAARLGLRGFGAAAVYDGASALSQLRQNTFGGVILDLRLPDIDGVEVLRKVMEDFPDTRVVIVSGHANEQEFKACLEIGALACFHKPVNIDTIIKAIGGGGV